MRKAIMVGAILLGGAGMTLGQSAQLAPDAADLWGMHYWTSSRTLKAGDTLLVKVTVENRGRAPAPGAARGGYMVDLSFGRAIAGFPPAPHTLPAPYRFVEGMLLKGGRVSATVDLAPGANKEYEAKVELPRDLKPGKYWLAVTVDPLNRVPEPQPHPHGEHDNISNLDIEIVR